MLRFSCCVKTRIKENQDGMKVKVRVEKQRGAGMPNKRSQMWMNRFREWTCTIENDKFVKTIQYGNQHNEIEFRGSRKENDKPALAFVYFEMNVIVSERSFSLAIRNEEKIKHAWVIGVCSLREKQKLNLWTHTLMTSESTSNYLSAFVKTLTVLGTTDFHDLSKCFLHACHKLTWLRSPASGTDGPCWRWNPGTSARHCPDCSASRRRHHRRPRYRHPGTVYKPASPANVT